MELTPELCRDAPFLHHETLLQELKDHGVTTYVQTPCQIKENGVVICQDGTEELLCADTVILTAGVKARIEEVENLRDATVDFRRIGDCKRARKVYDAIHEGYDAGVFFT